MWIKILFLCIAVVSLSAAERAGRQPKAGKKATDSEAVPLYDKKMFDPAIPRLTKEQVNSHFTRIKEKLLTVEFPPTVKQAKHLFYPEGNDKPAMLTTGRFSPLIFSYKRLTQNWELEEVTRTKLEYFNIVGRSLVAVMAPLSQLETAIFHQQEAGYKKAVADLEKALDALDKVIKEQKKYQLTAAEYAALRKKNMARRKTEIEALMKKLGVDKYGRPIRKKQGHR